MFTSMSKTQFWSSKIESVYEVETTRNHCDVCSCGQFKLVSRPPWYCFFPCAGVVQRRTADLPSVAANSSYRAWANTFTTKECDDLRSQWNVFFAWWKERGKKTKTNKKNECDIAQFLTHTEGINWMCGGNNKLGESKKKKKKRGKNFRVEIWCSPAARRRRRTDPGCSWANLSRCERRWEPRSSRPQSEDASCCTRRPGAARLQHSRQLLVTRPKRTKASCLPACLPAQPTSSN